MINHTHMHTHAHTTTIGDDPTTPEDAPAAEPPKRRGRPRKSEAQAMADAALPLMAPPSAEGPVASAPIAAAAAAAAPAPAVTLAAAAPLPRWDEAAAAGASEDDPRRLGLHRRLQAAAERGAPQDAEAALAAMGAAGLAPGPRAWHVLALAYLKAGDADGALEAAARAGDAGAPLLPDTYGALVFGLMQPPAADPEGARGVVETARAAGAAAALQARFVLLAQLEARGMHADAAREGAALLEEGAFGPLGGSGGSGVAASAATADAADAADSTVASRDQQEALAALVSALCALGRASDALALYGDALTAGRLEAPARLCAPVVRAFAVAGDVATAQQVLDEALRDGVRPDAACYNGLLEGLVAHMVPGGGEAEAGVRSDLVYGRALEDQ